MIASLILTTIASTTGVMVEPQVPEFEPWTASYVQGDELVTVEIDQPHPTLARCSIDGVQVTLDLSSVSPEGIAVIQAHAAEGRCVIGSSE